MNHRSLRPTERERESLDWKILWEVLMVVGMDSGVDFFGRGEGFRRAILTFQLILCLLVAPFTLFLFL